MGWTRQQYEDRIRNELGDLGVMQRIDDTRITVALEKAFLQYGKDSPRTVSIDLAGDGTTYIWNLATEASADWETNWSRVESVEYPAGERDPIYLEDAAWQVVDDTFALIDDTPATGETVRIRFATTWPYPDDTATTDLTTGIFGTAIASLAASFVARSIGLEYARKQSNSVAGTVIDLDPQVLLSAAKELRGVYEDAVLGRPAARGDTGGSSVAIATSNSEVFPNALFHRRG